MDGRGHDQRQHHRRQYSSDHRNRERLQHLRPGPDRERKRNHPGDRGERGHEDGAQTAFAGLNHGVSGG